MLWEQILVMLLLAIVSTILVFHRSIEPLGQTIFAFLASSLWPPIGQALLNINFRWAGSLNPISYTYITTDTARELVSYFSNLGIAFMLIGFMKAFFLVWGPAEDELGNMRWKRGKFKWQR